MTKRIYWLVAGVLSCPCAYSVIHEIVEIEDILPYVKAGPCTVVAFDIDNTILRGKDPRARDEWFNAQFKLYTSQGLSGDEAVKRILPEHIKAHRTTAVEQVDADEDEVFAVLHDRKVHAMALTARGDPNNFVDITLRQFHDAKVDLMPRHVVDAWKQCYKITGLARDAYYIPGIFLVNGNDKGMAFELFLKKLRYRPHVVVFVDDLMKNIEAVERACKRLGIKEYHCFHLSRVAHGLDAVGASLKN
ncbi:MAG: hypothetical protein UV38_C0001G0308 [candidate division TM6 bacterium GW2011_GWE2_42_60]|nr:MAG: hypothetical protein UV38_C0001G0308 [candidate division TM6 bacterium GW2011_GWE2_42_60]HBY05501.1 hypothetical protein [Candidatus Dependentiae bacterium]